MTSLKSNLKLLIALLLLTTWATAQSVFNDTTAGRYAAIDSITLLLPNAQAGTTQQIAEYINANFKTSDDKIRAIFIWVASNILYDLSQLKVPNRVETMEVQIARTLNTRKGVCLDFAVVFKDICLKCGLQSYVVDGYTKRDGMIGKYAHVWCAARVDGQWFLFDPTFASGYISQGRFVKKISNVFYKVPPSQFIKSHMPFDPMWQFLNYPVTNQDFYDDNTGENRSKQFFNYTDSLKAYDRLDTLGKYEVALRRIRANGLKNSLINYEIACEQLEVNYKLFNNAMEDYNVAVENYNKFLDDKDAQSKSSLPDTMLQAELDTALIRIGKAKAQIARIRDPEAELRRDMAPGLKQIEELMDQVLNQREWFKRKHVQGK